MLQTARGCLVFDSFYLSDFRPRFQRVPVGTLRHTLRAMQVSMLYFSRLQLEFTPLFVRLGDVKLCLDEVSLDICFTRLRITLPPSLSRRRDALFRFRTFQPILSICDSVYHLHHCGVVMLRFVWTACPFAKCCAASATKVHRPSDAPFGFVILAS